MRSALVSVILLASVAACEEAPTPSAAAPSASAAAEEAPAASCEAMCARATTCGVELAAELAAGAGTEAREQAARAKTDAEAREARCVRRCGTAEATERDAVMTRRCLAKDACRDFVACLDEGV